MQTQEKFSQVFPKNFKICFWHLVLLELTIIYFEKLFKGLVKVLKLDITRTKEVLKHGGSIVSSRLLRGTFRRISQLWDNTHTP